MRTPVPLYDSPFTFRLTARDRALLDAAAAERSIRPSKLVRDLVRRETRVILQAASEGQGE